MLAENIGTETGVPLVKSFNELGRMNVARKYYLKAIDCFMRSQDALAERCEKSTEKKR